MEARGGGGLVLTSEEPLYHTPPYPAIVGPTWAKSLLPDPQEPTFVPWAIPTVEPMDDPIRVIQRGPLSSAMSIAEAIVKEALSCFKRHMFFEK